MRKTKVPAVLSCVPNNNTHTLYTHTHAHTLTQHTVPAVVGTSVSQRPRVESLVPRVVLLGVSGTHEALQQTPRPLERIVRPQLVLSHFAFLFMSDQFTHGSLITCQWPKAMGCPIVDWNL
jgi:hypothetical protein